MRFSEYETDKALEEEGVWVRLKKGDGEVLVARAGSSRHTALIRKLRRKHAQTFRGDDLPEDLQQEIAVEALSQTILLGWRNLEDAPGEQIPFSVEKAKELLKRSRDFRNEIVEIANEMEVYRSQEVEAGKERSRK